MVIIERRFKQSTIFPLTILTAATPQVEKIRRHMLAHTNARTATVAFVDTMTWTNKFAYIFLAHTHRKMLIMRVMDT